MTTAPAITDRARAEQAAEATWKKLTDKEKAVVRFGMIPHQHAIDAEKEYGRAPDGSMYRDFGRLFAVALMGQAQRDGGMVA